MSWYIVLGSNTNRHVQAFGTKVKGNPFKTFDAAQRRADELERLYPGLDFMAMSIDPSQTFMED